MVKTPLTVFSVLSILSSICAADGRPGAAEAGRAGLSDPRPAVRGPGELQRTPGGLLLPEPVRHPELREEALHPGQPLPHAAGQHRLRGLHTGRVLGEQLQTGHWDQVRRRDTY